MEGNVGENVLLRLLFVLKIDMVEADIPFFDPDLTGVFVISDIDLFLKHLVDPLPGGQGSGQHHENVGEHHQGIEHLHHVA